jgi:hypothetical protein
MMAVATMKPVSVSKGAYAFCRYIIALMLWCALLFRSKGFVLAVFIILFLSVLLKVRRAPLIVLYAYSIDKLFPSGVVILDEKGIRFAHTVGTVVSFICVILLYFLSPTAGWILAILLTLLQTSAAFGFCSALKVYQCVTGSGSCCKAGKFVRRFTQ